MDRIRTFLLTSLLAFAMSGAHAAQASKKAKPAATPAPPVPLLWKACDADNCLYLLGSFHILYKRDYPLSKDVEAAFADAEQVMFEIPADELESPLLAMTMLQAAVREDGRTLSSTLKPALAAKWQAWLKKRGPELEKQGMPASMLEGFEPWFVGLLVTQTEMAAMGMQANLGLDRHFIARSAAAKKPSGGLESGTDQVALLDGFTTEEQLQLLEESLDSAGKGMTEMRKLHDAWRRGDAAMIIRETIDEMRREYPRLYRAINVERNDRWVPKLQQKLDGASKDDVLVVVGAMHLLGEDGVVEKLRAKGYRVERVCSACAKPKH